MKCVALSADSENSTPLLAMMPTRKPWSRANPVTSVGPCRALNSSNLEPSTSRAMTSWTSRLAAVGVDDPVELGRVVISDPPALSSAGSCFAVFSVETIVRQVTSACASSSAK